MRVDLRELVPNPFRDLTVDPIQDDPAIRESIRKHDFWGGTVVRRSNGTLQIAAGHRRVHEAIACGITHADLFVSETISDEDMVKIYATENATQRGVENSAVAGSIVAAIKLRLRRQFLPGILTHESDKSSGLFNEGNRLDGEEILTPEIGSENLRGGERRDGIGQDAIFAELGKIPGFTRHMIGEQLASLKLSGDYNRIVDEIIAEAEKAQAAEIARLEAERLKKEADERDRQRIEQELVAKRAEAEEIEKTKKANENAAQNRIEKLGSADPLDLAGISKHLKTPSHVTTFRRLVLADNVRNILPKGSQAALAEALAEKAKADRRELTSAFLHEHLYAMVTKVRETSKRQEKTFVNLDWESKARLYMEDFSAGCRAMISAGTKLAEHEKSRPKRITLHATGEFRNAIENVTRVLARLKEEKII